jgi:hypothetical protein
MTITNLVDDAPPVTPYGEPGYDAFLDLWSRLIRPFDVTYTVSAITGLSNSVVSHLVGTAIAGSAEATRLLDELPRTIRSLASSMTTQNERCKGELRGPVLWSETMSARASSFGDPDLYVCMTPSRAYDVDENQVLVSALLAVRDAAKDATDHTLVQHHEDAVLRAVKRNGNDAGRFVEHPSLQKVSRQRPKARAIKRTRAGKKSKVYEPAVAMLERAANPLRADDVRGWCDERTLMQIKLLMGVVHRLELTGNRLPAFRSERGALYSGPVQYYHGRLLGDEQSLSGVVIGSLLVDVPDHLADPNRARAEAVLEARSGGRETMIVMTEQDIDRAVIKAIELVRGTA